MAHPWTEDDDDCAPPPLSSLAEQVEALHVASAAQHGSKDAATGAEAAGASGREERLRVASCVVTSEAESTSATRSAGALQPAKQVAGPSLKKGFFDGKPAGKKPAPKKDDGLIVLKGRKDALGAKAIPDFLRVEPDEQELKYREMRGKLVDALKPDRDTVDKIASDKKLSAAFEDPEVMAAVNDIAQNPHNFTKYQNNPKVLAFYSSMGSLMGQRLEKMGPAAPAMPPASKAKP